MEHPLPKTILITGTSPGLGIAIAIQAAQAGHSVYATMRNLDKRDALDTAAKEAGVTLHVLPLDVQDSASITAAVDHILQADGQIDTLINAAVLSAERFYPAFQLVCWGNETPAEAMRVAIAEAYGRA